MAPPIHQLHSHRFEALRHGARVIITGAVHGNETCGTRAIERIAAELERGEIEVLRGSLTLVPVCNPLAYARGQRFGERNLNRRLQPSLHPADNEDRIANVLCHWMAAHEVLLDLHSFRNPGQPFVMRGPADNEGELEPFSHAAAEARLAAHLGPTRVVEGWMPVYAYGVRRRRERGQLPGGVNEELAYGVGTTEFMRSQGGYGVTLECGQHDDPQAVDVAYRAIRQTLALLGLCDLPLAPPAAAFECLSLTEVVDRLDEGDRFVKTWASFDALAAGELVGLRADGSEVRAPRAGRIVFPDPQAAPGHEWFYLAQPGERGLDL